MIADFRRPACRENIMQMLRSHPNGLSVSEVCACITEEGGLDTPPRYQAVYKQLRALEKYGLAAPYQTPGCCTVWIALTDTSATTGERDDTPPPAPKTRRGRFSKIMDEYIDSLAPGEVATTAAAFEYANSRIYNGTTKGAVSNYLRADRRLEFVRTASTSETRTQHAVWVKRDVA